MRTFLLVGLVSVSMVGSASAQSISGKYLEVRNAALWAGPCLVNSETGVVGDKATLVWKVDKGNVGNVSLDGLAIVAVVFGNETFGTGRKVTTRTVFVVDERADDAQQKALIKMAKDLAGETIQEVMETKRAKIAADIANDGSAYSHVDAGMATIRTRTLRRTDSLCGTDQTRMVYPALAKVSDERSAFTLENKYSTGQLHVDVRTFEDRNRPSAVVGSFTL